MALHVADPTNETHTYRFAHGPHSKKAKAAAPASAPRPTPQPAAARGGGPAVGPRQQTQGAAFDSFAKRTRRRDDGSEPGSSAEDDENGDE